MTIMDLLAPGGLGHGRPPSAAERGAQRGEVGAGAPPAAGRDRDGHGDRLPRVRARRPPRAAGAGHRHHRAQPHPGRAAPERGPAPARPAHRGTGPDRGRGGARLQQPAHHHPRLRGDAAARHGPRRPPPARRAADLPGRRPRAPCSRASCSRSGATTPRPPRPVNLNEVVRGMEPLVQRLVGADVRLDVRLAPGLGPVRIDPAQLEHVVVNLILNARDAMPAGGRLTHRDQRAPHQRAEPRPSGAPGPLRRARRSVTPGEVRRPRPVPTRAGIVRARARDRVRHRPAVRRGRPGIERGGRGYHGQGLPAAARAEPDAELAGRRRRRARCGARKPCWWPRTRTACASCCGRCSPNSATRCSPRAMGATR